MLVIFLGSLGASVAATAIGSTQLAAWLGTPAALLAGWAFVGHLITIDDDFPGGWSNPEGSKAILNRSVGCLAGKALAVALVVFLVFVLPVWREGLFGAA